MNEKLIEFIETSFLASLLENENITDISFNGENIFYKDNEQGRVKSEIKISSTEASDFIRQIANLTNQQFSVTNPILDVSVDKYRISATHNSVTRKNRRSVINFSFRIGYDKLRISDDFIPQKVLNLLKLALKHKYSIIIAGMTGTGKTEFQKYLLSKLDDNTRIILIDNINELETDFFTKNLDSQTWLVTKSFTDLGFDEFIKCALRCNPDWLIVNEARGKEMLSVLNSTMSGHPTITTVHSKESSLTYNRLARMCLISNEALEFEETLIDIYDHFKFICHLKAYYDPLKKRTIRYLDSIGTNDEGNYVELYKHPNIFNKIPNSLREGLEMTVTEFNKFNQEFAGKNKK